MAGWVVGWVVGWLHLAPTEHVLAGHITQQNTLHHSHAKPNLCLFKQTPGSVVCTAMVPGRHPSVCAPLNPLLIAN